MRDIDAARLVMLYALHYEKHTNNDIVGLVDALKHRGVSEHLTKVSTSCEQHRALRVIIKTSRKKAKGKF